MVKNALANAGDIRDMGLILDQEDPLEQGMPPTPIFLLGESNGLRSPAGYTP